MVVLQEEHCWWTGAFWWNSNNSQWIYSSHIYIHWKLPAPFTVDSGTGNANILLVAGGGSGTAWPLVMEDLAEEVEVV